MSSHSLTRYPAIDDRTDEEPAVRGNLHVLIGGKRARAAVEGREP